ncbi:GFA family protein [Pyxidicoccus xibeiensis]|uniref:GFA family protein n=1 Tax=Pyxidicoccus xibeiensis TaxID=2906759 RepID=UPI0020A7655F|nr:GFA family protein [Pyxidicoccus xibeiensis]MCP3143854.1 GFA family protein [Pyxidicoccus xibeiensis]
MILATCHCGRVSLEVQSEPTDVTECNCSICRRYGVLWAYYSPRQVRVVAEGSAQDTYQWGEQRVAFHRCAHCGCVSHWASLDPERDRMGVNARLMPLELLSKVRVRHRDGADTRQYLD